MTQKDKTEFCFGRYLSMIHGGKKKKIISFFFGAIALGLLLFVFNTQAATIATPTLNTSGLVGWWTFDGVNVNATQVLDKKGSNNLTMSSSPSIGKIGQGYKCSASKTGTITTTNLDPGTGDFYLSIWAKSPADTTSLQGIVGKLIFGVGADEYGIGINLGKYFAKIAGGVTPVTLNALNNFTPNQWYHLILQRASGVSYFYINNVLQASSNSAADDITTVTPFTVCMATYVGNQYRFLGTIDDLRYGNKLLSLREIQQLYQMGGGKISSTPTLNTSGLVGHWTFDGRTVGSTWVTDAQGKGYSGTRTGGTVVPGKSGQALYFDGIDDLVSLNDQAAFDFGTGNFSMSVWVKTNMTVTDNTKRIIHRESGNIFTGIGYLVETGVGTARLNIRDATDITASGALQGNTLSNNRWKHIVFTVERNSTIGNKIYENGVFVAAADNSTENGSLDMTTALTFGGQSGERYFRGVIDEVKLFNRALTIREIQQLYQAGK